MTATDIRVPAEGSGGPRDSLARFAELVGWPLTEPQTAALALARRITAIVAPRQTGKSYALAVLAVWWAFRKPDQRVLIIGAGDEAAKRLLGMVRAIVSHPLLTGSVVDEGQSLVVLSNGSEIRSVPSSEKQVRGWSVDLLLVDEAAMVDDDLLLSAALPTTAARPDARIVVVSTPWTTSGVFYDLAQQGLDGGAEHVRTYRWSLADAPWISASMLALARETLGDIRYRVEYEAEFLGRVDAFLDPTDILACVTDYALLEPARARWESIIVGADWGGGSRDPHAVVALAVLDDHGANERPVLFLPWLETAYRPFAEQVDAVANLQSVAVARPPAWPGERPKSIHGAGYSVELVNSEANGVGSMPSEQLAIRLGRHRVEAVHSSQRSKEDGYGKVRAWLSDRRLVLPSHPELLRQLRGLTYEATPSGGLSISAGNPNVHDDLADAAYLAALAVPANFRAGPITSEPTGIEWSETPSGVRIPRHPRPRSSSLRHRGGRLSAFG